VQSIAEVQLTPLKVPPPPGAGISVAAPQVPPDSVAKIGSPLLSRPTAVQFVAEMQLTPLKVPPPPGAAISVAVPQVPPDSVAKIGWPA
jgi:hypothetical protein